MKLAVSTGRVCELTINITVSTFIFIYLHLVPLENPDDILSYYGSNEKKHYKDPYQTTKLLGGLRDSFGMFTPILEEISQFDLHIETTN